MTVAEVYDNTGRLRERWDSATSLYTAWDAAGAQTTSRSFTTAEATKLAQLATDEATATRNAAALVRIDAMLARGKGIQDRAVVLQGQAAALSQKTTAQTVAEQKAFTSAVAELFGGFAEVTGALRDVIRELRGNYTGTD